jgi:glycosyltransferase involved in cell wall biosynthesis
VLKLLVVAPTCDGTDVGEAWVAHQWVSRLARRHDVTLLTYHKRGRTPAAEQLSGLRVVEWAEPPVVGRAERLNSMLKPAYFPFYAKARRWIREAQARGEHFDLAHQPVPVAMRYPSPVAGLGIPYLIGPVGGSLDSPQAFKAEEGTNPWFVGLRNLDSLRIRRDPLLRKSYEDASVVLGIAPYVRDNLAGLSIKRFEVLSETAIDGVAPEVDRAARTGPLRLLFVGRLIRTKGVRDAVRAMAQLRDVNTVLDVIGDGPEREACEALVTELGLAGKVVFHGRLPREEIDTFYRDADVFVFPSYREPGGNVAFEAMAFGLPLIVCDRGGPGNVVDDSCGIKLPAVSPDQLARDVAGAVRTLAADPTRRLALGAGARRRVQRIALWDSKIDDVDALYEQVLAAGVAR